MGRRITLKDVADAASVTTATVSYVINNTPGQKITEETRRRVLEAAKRLRYTPNNAARALKSSYAGCVGVVIKKNLAVPRFSQTLEGIQKVLEQAGMSLLLCTNSARINGLTDYVNAYLEHRVDGVVYLGKDNQGPDEVSREIIATEKIPFVVFDCLEEADAYSTVDFAYRSGARLLTKKVLGIRPKTVVYLRPRMDNAQERLREQGVRDALLVVSDVKLSVCELPIDLENLELWDRRYLVGNTAEVDELTRSVMETIRSATCTLVDGDAVISSWAGWSNFVHAACSDTRIVCAELANNGERNIGARWCTRLPNYEAGCACAEEVLTLMGRAQPSARTLKLTTIVESLW